MTESKCFGRGKVAQKRAFLAQVAALNVLVNDRRFNPRRAARLQAAIDAGTSRPFMFAICHCLSTGDDWRVNGQHSLSVLSNLTDEALADVFIIVEYAEADSIEGVVALWDTYDPRGSARNAHEVLRCAAGIIPEFAALTPQIVESCVGSLDVFEHSSYPLPQVAPTQRPSRYRGHARTIAAFDAIRQQGGATAPNHATAAAFLSILTENEAAATSLLMAMNDESLASNSIPRKLRLFLDSYCIGSRRSNRRTTVHPTVLMGGIWYAFEKYLANPQGTLRYDITERKAKDAYDDFQAKYRHTLNQAVQ